MLWSCVSSVGYSQKLSSVAFPLPCFSNIFRRTSILSTATATESSRILLYLKQPYFLLLSAVFIPTLLSVVIYLNWLCYLGITCPDFWKKSQGNSGHTTRFHLKNTAAAQIEHKQWTSEHSELLIACFGVTAHWRKRLCATVDSQVGLRPRGFNIPLGLLFLK